MSCRFLVSLACFGLLPVLAGCPDPDVEYADFVERFDKIPKETSGSGGGLSCAGPPAAGEADGEWIFLLTVVQSPDKPAPLRAQITNTDTEFTMELTPMDANDRMSDVGASLGSFGPFAINPDATFTADLGQLSAPGETNPITDNQLTIIAMLEGTFCPGDFQCGTASGNITEPAPLDLDGTWTLTRASTYMEPPVTNCGGKTAAGL